MATDQCAGAITGTTTDPLTYNLPGEYIIHWTFDDGHNNRTVQEQRVIIRNKIAPVPYLTALPDITGECSAAVKVTPLAKDYCGNKIAGTTTDPLTYQQPGNYTIRWMYKDGAGNTATQLQQVIVRSLALSLHVFPNPSSTYFNITIKSCNRQEVIMLTVFDAMGRLVETRRVNPDQTITAGAGYPGGMFFAQLTQGRERLVVKLLKQ